MQTKNLESKATVKYLRLSPNKTRRVLDQIRGKNYQEALLLLKFMPYRSCKIIHTIIESAINNAKNLNLDKEKLIIKQAFADTGPKLKRFQPRAQGRAFPIHKPTCHITIKLGYQ
uniref:Large ribosomal subunit protein uL22c n=1 Tax=Sebdenia flabellata TaxID=42024 RepID=A0A1C9CA90_9FLOR|nr:ribosomal protein L22 [Sebdenia flabellata]AOM65287.1 ribosomal protein L22 [Sebdenia flabellata]